MEKIAISGFHLRLQFLKLDLPQSWFYMESWQSAFYSYKSSNRSMEVNFQNFKEIMTDRPTKQPTLVVIIFF